VVGLLAVLPGGGEEGADDGGPVNLARVGVDPAVVHRILGDQVELVLLHPDIAQPGRQGEPGDQAGDDIRGGLARMAEGVAEAGLLVGVTGWLKRSTCGSITQLV
jgi:hypothetical protein